LSSLISNTSTGHTSTQVPHPLHFAGSTFTSTKSYTVVGSVSANAIKSISHLPRYQCAWEA